MSWSARRSHRTTTTLRLCSSDWRLLHRCVLLHLRLRQRRRSVALVVLPFAAAVVCMRLLSITMVAIAPRVLLSSAATTTTAAPLRCSASPVLTSPAAPLLLGRRARCGAGGVSRIDRVERVSGIHRNGATNEALNVAQEVTLLRCAERDRVAACAGAASTPNAMHVRLRLVSCGEI